MLFGYNSCIRVDTDDGNPLFLRKIYRHAGPAAHTSVIVIDRQEAICLIHQKFVPAAVVHYMHKMKKMTQEQLAEAAGVGVTHISHIETGNSVPSLQVMVDIINALDCSADELLCVEIDQARPLVNCWLSELVDDCSGTEIKLISDVVISLKSSMRRLKIDGQ